jgi:hypothetical protein
MVMMVSGSLGWSRSGRTRSPGPRRDRGSRIAGNRSGLHVTGIRLHVTRGSLARAHRAGTHIAMHGLAGAAPRHGAVVHGAATTLGRRG